MKILLLHVKKFEQQNFFKKIISNLKKKGGRKKKSKITPLEVTRMYVLTLCACMFIKNPVIMLAQKKLIQRTPKIVQKIVPSGRQKFKKSTRKKTVLLIFTTKKKRKKCIWLFSNKKVWVFLKKYIFILPDHSHMWFVLPKIKINFALVIVNRTLFPFF